MRDDARNLLDRLGAGGFDYREFAGRFPDREPWPLFVVLLGDGSLRGPPAPLLPDGPADAAGGQDAREMQRRLAELAAAGAL